MFFVDDISISSSQDLQFDEDYDPESISMVDSIPESNCPDQFRERLFSTPRNNIMDRTCQIVNPVHNRNNGFEIDIPSDSNSLNSESGKSTRFKGCGNKVLICSIL